MNIAHLYHVNTITKAFRNSELHLSPLLIFTWYRKATDPKDRIFALLGLLPEGLYPTLKPDYHLQPSEVFIAVTRVCIEVDKSLAILRTAGLKYRRDVLSPHMASWVPDFVNHEDPEKSSDEVFDLVDTRIATRYMTPVMGPRSVGLRLQLRGFVVGIMSKCVHPASPNVPWGLSFCMKPVHAGNWSDGFELSACRAHRSWNDRSDRKNKLCRAFGINKGWYKEGDWYCVMLGGNDFYILRPCEGNQPTMRNAASDGPICSLVCSGAEEGMGNLSLEDGLVQSAFASHEARNDWVDFILV